MNMYWNIKRRTSLSGLIHLVLATFAVLVGLVLFSPRAQAAACNDTASLPFDGYGIGTTVRADIYDTRGNFLRHSNDFSFRVTTVDLWGYGYTQAQLDWGIAQWPEGRGGRDFRYFTKDFTVNASQGDNCADAGGPGKRFIFSSVNGTSGFLLDCIWDAKNNGTVTHRFDLLSVNDSFGDPWAGFQSITPTIVVAGYDMNDQPIRDVVFRFIEKPHGTIQGYKVDRATLRDGNGDYKNATITASGPRPATDSGQPYHLQLEPGSYSLNSSAIPGWRLVGYTYNSSYYDIGTGPFGNLSSVNINDGETKDIWFVYDRNYYPWLQSFNGDVVANGVIAGQEIGLSGGRSNSAFDKEASYLVIINAVGASGSNFCSTNAYSIGNPGGGNCNPQTYVLNNKYFDYNSVASGVEKLWNENGSGSGSTCTSGLSRYLTGSLSSSSGTLNHPGITDLSDGCDNGKIWKATGNYKLGSKTFDQGRATYWIDGNLALTGNITANTNTYSNPKRVPNLGIIVKGDITIDPSVTEIDASLFATGKIYTCHPSGSPVGGTAYYKNNGPACKKDLRINGLMSAANGFTLGRTYISTFGGGTGDPAEKLSASAQAMAFPPPGFGDDGADQSLLFQYLGESNPRF